MTSPSWDSIFVLFFGFELFPPSHWTDTSFRRRDESPVVNFCVPPLVRKRQSGESSPILSIQERLFVHLNAGLHYDQIEWNERFVEIYDQSKKNEWTVDYGRLEQTEDVAWYSMRAVVEYLRPQGRITNDFVLDWTDSFTFKNPDIKTGYSHDRDGDTQRRGFHSNAVEYLRRGRDD